MVVRGYVCHDGSLVRHRRVLEIWQAARKRHSVSFHAMFDVLFRGMLVYETSMF